MPMFEYRARGPHGDAVEGTLEAASADAVASRLLDGGLTPVQIQTARVKSGMSRDLNDVFPPRVRDTDLIQLCRQMHSLLRAGVPILSGLNGLASTTRNPTLAKALREVRQMLEGGHDLASSLAQHPDVFDHFFVSLVRVGETSGQLDDTFQQLAYYLEREKLTRDQIKKATRYPSFVLLALVGALMVINYFVIPAFTGVYAKFDAELPLATRIVVGLSEFTRDYWLVFFLGLVGAFFGIRSWLRTEQGRFRWDRYKLRIPLIGPVLTMASLGRFTRLFGMSQQAGVPLITSLSVVARALDNHYLEERVLTMRDGIERGESISATAGNSGIFDPLVLQMIAVGEESGTLDELLKELAGHYDREVEYSIDKLSSAIGPVLTILIGVIMLIVALAIFLPMWNSFGVILGR
jgi:MSHA biogenesis protein MshG